MDKNINLFINKLKKIFGFSKVKFVILYGSRAIGNFRKDSDYDFAVYFEGDGRQRFDFLVKANFDDRFDVKIFQDLPLYVQKEVFKGRVVYCKDLTFVYDVAYQTIKDFEMFKKYYYDYIATRRLKIK